MSLDYYIYSDDGLKKKREEYSQDMIKKFDNLLLKSLNDKSKDTWAVIVEINSNRYLIERV